MKFRTDYVTNSSSSSFVCEICGHVESGWDISLQEAEMMECVNGHIFCCDEALERPSKEELIKRMLEDEYNLITRDEMEQMDDDEVFETCTEYLYEVPECMCPICQFIEYSEYDLSAYLLKEYGVSRDEVFEEVKKFNKRRKKLYENEYITHVCKQFNLNPANIVADWKEKFGTYKKFKEYIRR